MSNGLKRVLKSFLYVLPDTVHISIKYFLCFHRFPNLKKPKTFNEKLQWLKLHNRKDKHTLMVDKVAVKEYISQRFGERYVIPNVGVWNNPEEIDFDKLPKKFVIKCNHNSGEGMYICKDKSVMDIKKVKSGLNKGLKQNYYLYEREWPYKNVPRKIIAEEYLEDGSGSDLKDYKVFNFNGEPHFIQVDFDRFCNHKKNIYTPEWKLCDFEFNYPRAPETVIEKPENLEEMLDISRELSKDEPFVRTDFYVVDGNIYFGEVTYFPASGYGKFSPTVFDEKLGEMIDLSCFDRRGRINA